MSKDCSGLMFPKPKKKKKRKRHKASIVNSVKGECFLCALDGDKSIKYTEEHHVAFGGGRRSISEAEGIKVYLCREHHKDGQKAVHNCRKTRNRLCSILQAEYEKTHVREEWMAAVGKNYL